MVKDFFLITSRKVMYIANVGDDDSANPAANPHVKKLMDYAATEGAPVIPICGKIESEIAELDEAEKAKFLTDYGMAEPGLNRVKVAGYDLLGLQTFFTAGDIEIKAWTIKKGMRAPQAAGVIHSDFERGFIRAEVIAADDLAKFHTVKDVRAHGKERVEGKTGPVHPGRFFFG